MSQRRIEAGVSDKENHVEPKILLGSIPSQGIRNTFSASKSNSFQQITSGLFLPTAEENKLE